jgi:hypothetical protein
MPWPGRRHELPPATPSTASSCRIQPEPKPASAPTPAPAQALAQPRTCDQTAPQPGDVELGLEHWARHHHLPHRTRSEGFIVTGAMRTEKG